jgi:hypothetical protein
LEAAGIPYVTDDGYADFHSLRHAFISMVAQGGASPKVAQELARHSTVQLTLGRYAHAGLYDVAAAVESLPRLLPTAREAVAATGTDGKPPEGPPKRLGSLRTDDLPGKRLGKPSEGSASARGRPENPWPKPCPANG